MRGPAALELALVSASLLTLASDFTACFVAGIVVTLVDTTDVVVLDTTVALLGSFLLGAEVVSEVLDILKPDVLKHFVTVAPGGFFTGKDAGTTFACC